MTMAGEANSAPGARKAQGLALLVAGLLCLVPFLNPLHALPIPTFYEEWLAFVLGLAAAALCGLFSRAGPAVPRVALWLGALAVVIALQWLLGWTAYRETTQLGTLYVLWAMLLVWLGAELRERCGAERASRMLAWFLVAGALVNAAMALLQGFTGTIVLGGLLMTPPGGRASGMLGQANLLANHLVLGGAALIYLAASSATRPLVAVVLALPMLAAIALTGSRAALLMFGWLIAWSVIGLRGQGRPARVALAGAIAGAALIVALQFVLLHIGGLGALRGEEASALGRLASELAQAGQPVGGIGARIFLWKVAADIFGGSPLLGAGLGEFGWAYFMAHPPGLIPELGAYQRQAHNLVLQLLAETGAVGAIALVAGLAGWLLRVVHAQARQWSAPLWLAGAVVGVELAHSLVEFPLWYAHFLGVGALFLGMGERSAFALRSTLARWLPVLAAAGGIALAAGALWWHQQLTAWVYALPDAALDDPLVRERQRDVLRRAGATLLRPYAELPIAAVIEPSRERLAATLALNERVMHFAPIGPVIYRQAALLALAGRRAEAQALFDRAAKLHPGLRAEFVTALETWARAEPDALGWLLDHARTARGN